MVTIEKDKIRSYDLQSVNQALDLIDALIAAREGQTLSDLSRLFGMSKNKMFRMLSTLEQRGMVEKDRYSRYRLGIAAFGTAHRILSSESMLDLARPVMVELAAKLNEAVYLAKSVGGEVIFHEMIDCHHPIRTESFVGMRFPLPDATVVGSFVVQFDVAGEKVFVSELDAEVTAVSAALNEYDGTVAGALVVLAPTFRLSTERISSEITQPLAVAVQRLTLMLGCARIPAELSDIQLQPLDYSDNHSVLVSTSQEHFRQGARQFHY